MAINFLIKVYVSLDDELNEKQANQIMDELIEKCMQILRDGLSNAF